MFEEKFLEWKRKDKEISVMSERTLLQIIGNKNPTCTFWNNKSYDTEIKLLVYRRDPYSQAKTTTANMQAISTINI